MWIFYLHQDVLLKKIGFRWCEVLEKKKFSGRNETKDMESGENL